MPHSASQRRILTVVFLTIFLDVVGLSVIFPLYPSILLHYMEADRDGQFMGATLAAVAAFRALAGAGAGHVLEDAALFGGILGSAYAALQFLFVPLLGRLSDRYGRRPVLLACIAGIAASYVLWFFAGGFALVVLSHLLGGMMSANAAIAGAAIADTATGARRTRGMALVGAAFGAGFLFGPPLGALAARVDLAALYPAGAAWGLNPFSAAALVSIALMLLNLALVWWAFEETRAGTPAAPGRRPGTLMALWPRRGAGIVLVNWSWFLFQMALAGTTFALPFHAAQRLGYGPGQITGLLIALGIALALVQATYVRRYSARIEARTMLAHGLLLAIPALACIGWADRAWVLYAGVILLGVGGALVQPCLAALTSEYSPNAQQGRAQADFRALGALGRVIGRVAVALVYWRLGPAESFYASAAFMALPLALALRLPPPAGEDLSADDADERG
jgi:MFS family permease